MIHALSTAPYPRRGGVLIPNLLVRAGCPAARDLDTPAERARAVRDTVAWIRASLRDLPWQVRVARLPDPGTMLRSWRLSARTRGMLARLETHAPLSEWSVGDLLGAKRLGPVTLLDLLAAREENERGPTLRQRPATVVAADQRSRLDALTEAIRSRLPCRADELGEALRADGHAGRPTSVAEVGRLYRDWNTPAPFRVIRREGAHILVATESLSSATEILASASRMVFREGLCAIESVAARMRAVMRTWKATLSSVARLLATLPRFRWLDEPGGWFSFSRHRGPFRTALEKIFAIARRVSLSDLRRAFLDRGAFAAAPRLAIERYFTEIVGCDVRNDWVCAGASIRPAPLPRAERTFVAALSSRRHEATEKGLQVFARTVGIDPATVRRFVRTSPLIVSRTGEIRLVGSDDSSP